MHEDFEWLRVGSENDYFCCIAVDDRRGTEFTTLDWFRVILTPGFNRWTEFTPIRILPPRLLGI